MKHILLILFFVFPFIIHSQALSSLKGKPVPSTVEYIEIRLDSFRKQHSIGVKLLLASTSVIFIGYSINKLEPGNLTNTLMISSGLLSLTGTIVILDSPTRLKRAFY
jgi:hypothetical protein